MAEFVVIGCLIVLLLTHSPQTILMIHPYTELGFANPQIGLGVFATRVIPKGTITWVRDRLDQALTPAAIAQLPTAYHDIILKYSFIDGGGRFVLCWDHARFVNHSCNPTCRSAGYDFEWPCATSSPARN